MLNDNWLYQIDHLQTFYDFAHTLVKKEDVGFDVSDSFY